MILNKDSIIKLIFTVILGLIFTLLQALEYIEAIFSIRENCYGSSFFVTTGFHGTHVIIGTIFLFYCLKYIKIKNLRKWQHLGYEFRI
jgi:heme/copper-type cytochrome/quinol oxidase subunit 3